MLTSLPNPEPAAAPEHGDLTTSPVTVTHLCGNEHTQRDDLLAVEEPLEIRLAYGPRVQRTERNISVTMRTPGHDAELAAGFLFTEGVLNDAADLESIEPVGHSSASAGNSVRVSLAPGVHFNVATLERNFYTTSSCGICGKASLLALRAVCPPRRPNRVQIAADVLYTLPLSLRAAQSAFDHTGGLHACGLFTLDGELLAVREDVGRHNACDKLIGEEFLQDRTPLRDRILLLSGRTSFELLQKAVMAGVPVVASVGAPSSLALQVAQEFDVTLIGFLRGKAFNVYHGAERVQSHREG